MTAATGASQRRQLQFDRIDQVMPEVDRLLAGYRAVGQWTLGQVCNHLTVLMLQSVEGFPKQMPRIVRRTVGPLVYRRISATGKMPAGVPAPRQYQPSSGLDDRAEAESLRAAVRLFSSHTGPLAEHPFFGSLDRNQWNRLHCIHCAHHLGFLLPELARAASP